MNVLITGGTGFIGSRLALTCIDLGYSVRVLGQENTSAEAENRQALETAGVEIMLGSVTDRSRVQEAVAGCHVVFHLAATQHEMNVPDQRFWDVNVGGTRNVLEASVEAGVTRFVHGSTIGVYGNLEGTIDETSPCLPDNIYGETKLAAEQLVFSFSDQLPVVVIRISEVYGPGDRRLLKLFKSVRKNRFPMIGDGENIHHLVYIRDLCAGFLLAATNKNAVGELFVLAGKEPVTTDEMITVIAREMDSQPPRMRLPFGPMLAVAAGAEMALRPLGIQPPIHRRRMDFFKKSFAFSMDKSASMLHYEPQVDFRRGVAETANWYEQGGYL